MSETLVIVFTLLLMALLLFNGIPIAYSLIVSSALAMIYLIGFGPTVSILVTTTHSEVANYLFATIPLYVLMAQFLSTSGLVRKIFDATNEWVGHIPGGLAMATTIANGGMAALSGSSTAAAISMSKIAFPEMDERGYDQRLSMGVLSAAGTFSIMIPPSLGLIIYGILTQQNIATLFIAGIVPGLLTVVFYLVVIYGWSKYDPSVAPEVVERKPLTDRLYASVSVYPAVLLILLVLGGLYTGVVTPTEAGGLGAMGAFTILLFQGNQKLAATNEALAETARLTAMLFILLVGAQVMGRMIALLGVLTTILEFIASIPLGPWGILIIILLFYLLLGTFMSQAPILFLTLPLSFPIAIELGFDPIWYGIVIVKTVEIGMITPPFGLNVYVASGAVNVEPATTFRGAVRFLIPDCLILVLLLLLPELALWLPRTMS
jgi:tripartite ATP-independent transporter DctM subunit